MCLEIYELAPAKRLSAPTLTWTAAWKKTRVKLDISTDISMLLMVEKGIRGGIYHSIYWYVKVNKKYMKGYEKIVNFSIFNPQSSNRQIVKSSICK